MKRTKNIHINKAEDLKTLASALVARSNLAMQLGIQSYGGDRNITQALGYLDIIKYEDCVARYLRQDMAKAIIDRPVKATWQGDLCIQENNTEKDTQIELAWKRLNKDLRLKSKFIQLDKLVGLGKYGVLLMGTNDVKTNEDFAKPIQGKLALKLLYIMPFGEKNAQITQWETNPNDPRYGKPLLYSLSIIESETGISNTIRVHYSRIIHVVEDSLDSDIYGLPRLDVVFNRLMDLEKIVGGDAEMFWRNARPGYQGKVDDDYQMTTETKEDLQNQIDEYEHNLRRLLVTKGVSYESLSQVVSEPTAHVDIQIQMISSVTGIPKRILVGSERGELSSGQDADEWDSYVQNRRDEFAGPMIITPFVEFCIKYKILPEPSTKDWAIKWSDLFAESEKERIEIGAKRATALKDYLASPIAQSIVTPEAFLEFFLGLTNDQIDLINKMVSSEIKKELPFPEDIEPLPDEQV